MKELWDLIWHFRLKALLLEPSNDTWIQLFRSLFVGAAAFAADALLLLLGETLLGLHYLLAALLGFLLGVAVNYLLSSFFVFRAASSGKSKSVEVLVFLLLAAVGLVLTELLLWLLTDLAGLHYMISKVLATLVVFLWNFFGRKMILYRQKD